jgi:hypothetical protein
VMRAFIVVLSGACAVFSLSCGQAGPRMSNIVREAEQAGAGNVSTFSEPGLYKWFGAHQDVAKRITEECRPLSEKAGAGWIMTTEGTVCHSASLAAAWAPKPITADQRAW